MRIPISSSESEKNVQGNLNQILYLISKVHISGTVRFYTQRTNYAAMYVF